VDSKAECDQLNLPHETKTKIASAHLVQYRFKIRKKATYYEALFTIIYGSR